MVTAGDEPAWPAGRLAEDKAAARRQARQVLGGVDLRALGSAAMERLLARLRLTGAGRVAVYLPRPDEVSLGALTTAAWADRVAYARCRPDATLEFTAWDGRSAMVPDALKAMAPPPACPALPGEVLRIILVPGLAFGPAGERLGRGKGCYDEALLRLPHALRVAVAAECHLWASVPVSPRDLPVDLVVTEARIHLTGARRIPPGTGLTPG